jgi:hypothetical protein
LKALRAKKIVPLAQEIVKDLKVSLDNSAKSPPI